MSSLTQYTRFCCGISCNINWLHVQKYIINKDCILYRSGVAVSREKRTTGLCLRTLFMTCCLQSTSLNGLQLNCCSVYLAGCWWVASFTSKVSSLIICPVQNSCWCLFLLWHFSLTWLLLQVHQFSNKQTEMALRVASLDYLGTVASRLRKDAVTSQMDQKAIDRIVKEVG